MKKPSTKQIKLLMSYLGKRSASKLTPAQRSQRAYNAVQVRLAKRREKEAATP